MFSFYGIFQQLFQRMIIIGTWWLIEVNDCNIWWWTQFVKKCAAKQGISIITHSMLHLLPFIYLNTCIVQFTKTLLPSLGNNESFRATINTKKYVWSFTEKLCAFYVPIYEVFVENVSQRKTWCYNWRKINNLGMF